jgi:hypothetical protein
MILTKQDKTINQNIFQLACYLNIPNQISKKRKPKSSRVGKIQNEYHEKITF